MFADQIQSLEQVVDMLGPWWLEVCFMVAFPLGYYFLSLDVWARKSKKQFTKVVDPVNTAKVERLQKLVETDYSSGDLEGVLKQWRKAQSTVASSAETLKLVTQALVSLSPRTLTDELAAHVEAHPRKLCNSKTALVVLDAVGHSQNIALIDEVCRVMRDRLKISMTYQMYEALLAGHAFNGNVARVDEICDAIKAIGQKLTARAFALVIKGFLCRGSLDAAMKHTVAMRRQGFYVPPFAVSLLVRVGSENQRIRDVIELCTKHDISFTPESVYYALEDCVKRHDLKLADHLEACLRSAGGIPASSYDPLLKINVHHAHPHALELWEEMVKHRDVKIGEGFCVGLLARSAEPKFLRFAEEVLRYARQKNLMSIAVYSAMMKVYAFCGFYGHACDLYPELKARGMKPDSIMYGCLMRFAVECGRSELLKELADFAPQLDVQNYISLIRAAGREKDAPRALSLLAKLEGLGEKVDLAAYNCVLDACISAGAVKEARELATRMRKMFGRLDTVSYNILLKGFTAVGDLGGAHGLLAEMGQDGTKANDVSYNSIINAAVCAGNFHEAWRTIDLMEASGIQPDHYTASIMLKALKRRSGPEDVKKVMNMLEKLKIDVCQEEVLLNSLVEVCMHIRDFTRLQDTLSRFEESGHRPTQHLYGALIKAYSSLRRLDRVRGLWTEMVEERAMQPNDIVLGCMLDALICNNALNEALELLKKWKTAVGVNMVMYSTLVKGFANEGRAAEAMDLWNDIRQSGVQTNTVVYNALIDAQARQGRTEQVETLFKAMREDGVQPDSITYSTMAKAHCVKGELEKAMTLLSQMHEKGLVKDSIVFNTILDWCIKHGRMDIADRVMADFERMGVAPSNFTVGILVKMYGRRRELDKAFEVAESMSKKYSFKLNSQVYTCLMSACVLNNDMRRALQIFEELRTYGLDFKSFNVMIGGLLRAGRPKEAAEKVIEAYGLNGTRRWLPHGQVLGADILENTMAELGRHGLADSIGMPLVASLREANVPVNGKLLTTAFRTPPKPRTSSSSAQGAWVKPVHSGKTRRETS